MKTKNSELLEAIQKQKFITEKQILLLKHRIQKQLFENSFKDENNFDEIEELQNFMRKNNFEINLLQEQKIKGVDYFKKKYFTQFGYLRHNKEIKFNSDILNILVRWNNDRINNEIDFKFCGFVIITNGIMKFIEPIYKCNINFRFGENSFLYFHFNGTDYEYLQGKFLKGNNILYVEGRI